LTNPLENVSTQTLVKELRRRGNLDYATVQASYDLMMIELYKNDVTRIVRRELAEQMSHFLLDQDNWPIETEEVDGRRNYRLVFPVLFYKPKG